MDVQEPENISPAEMIERLTAGANLMIMVPDLSDPCGGTYVARPVMAVFPADVPMGDGSDQWTQGRHQIYFGGDQYTPSLITYPPTRYAVVPPDADAST
ncbi:hypothetical protein [Kutzneria sp. 744]|uniref:hypothetical protein n=1 Tax=Kutzneria sp. (strain 744) TaxID=345341 RepID=UPI0004B5C468|nr:hypothetical protein [Kutzneria sp. 744]